MTRSRQQNVTAAQWSSNGGALGAEDLTIPENNPFGQNVFSVAVQRDRLPKDVFEKLQTTLDGGEALDPSLADAVAASQEAGHRVTFLGADADDWPRLMYEKLGFETCGTMHVLRRTLHQG